MSAPARRLALAAAPAVLACALLAAPAAALPEPARSGPVLVVGTGTGPGPAAGDLRAGADSGVVPVPSVLPEPVSALVERGQGPLLAVGLAVAGLVGAFVGGLSRRPDPVD